MNNQRMIINLDATKKNANLSTIPAFIDQDSGAVTYWAQLSKEQVFEFWKYAVALIKQYPDYTAGSNEGCALLGTIEDVWPEYSEEFESTLNLSL